MPRLYISRFFNAAFRIVCSLAVVGLISILLMATSIDYLVALITPPLKSVRVRISALVAKCRHRITNAGGLFVVAASA